MCIDALIAMQFEYLHACMYDVCVLIEAYISICTVTGKRQWWAKRTARKPAVVGKKKR